MYSKSYEYLKDKENYKFNSPATTFNNILVIIVSGVIFGVILGVCLPYILMLFLYDNYCKHLLSNMYKKIQYKSK